MLLLSLYKVLNFSTSVQEFNKYSSLLIIHNSYITNEKPSPFSSKESDDDEISHLEWETVRVRFLKAGTLEKLIESLASDSGELESTFVNVFLATYRTFASTKQVLNLILDRYLALNSSSNKIKIPPHLREDHKK